MELQLINSVSDNAIGNFGDFILGKVQRTIENPLSLILDPINMSARDTVKSISGNLQEITGSENKRGLAAINQTVGGFIDNSINNISPQSTILIGLGLAAVVIIALKV